MSPEGVGFPGSMEECVRISASRLFLVLLVPVLAACYVPAPAEITAIGPGEDLRVLVSPVVRNEDSGQALIGLTELRGEFLRLTTDSLTIATELSVQSYLGSTMEDIRQPVTLPRSDILQVTVPRLHRPRTFAVVGSVVVLGVVILTDLFNIRGDGGNRPSTPPPDVSPFTGRW